MTELCIARSNGANNVTSVSDQLDFGQHIQSMLRGRSVFCFNTAIIHIFSIEVPDRVSTHADDVVGS